jgi:transcriptional regulator with XRE-family HTH domain
MAMKRLKPKIGLLVREARERKGLTQRDVASRVNIKASHVAYIENDKRRPSMELLLRLSRTLSIDRKRALFAAYPVLAKFNVR